MSGEAGSGLKSGTAQNCAYHKTQTMIREKQSGAHPDLSPDARPPNFSSVFFTPGTILLESQRLQLLLNIPGQMSGEAGSGLKSGTAQNCTYHMAQTMIR